MDQPVFEVEQRPTASAPALDPGSIRILQIVGDAQRDRRGRGAELTEICDLVTSGPLLRREVGGREGAVRRVHQLIDCGYLRLDRWDLYHVTANGWADGLGRPLEAFARPG